MVRVVHQLLHPLVADEDGLLLGVILFWLEALLRSFGNNLLHVVLLEGAENAEEELSLRKLARELFLAWKVL